MWLVCVKVSLRLSLRTKRIEKLKQLLLSLKWEWWSTVPNLTLWGVTPSSQFYCRYELIMLLKIESSRKLLNMWGQKTILAFEWHLYIYISVFTLSFYVFCFGFFLWWSQKMKLTWRLGFEFLSTHWYQYDIGPHLSSLSQFPWCKTGKTIIHGFEIFICKYILKSYAST